MDFKYVSLNGTRIEFYLPTEPTLPEVLDSFQKFIKACGYYIPDNMILDIREEDS